MLLTVPQDSLAENFIESWIYSSCLNIVDTCDEWKAALPPKPLLPTSNQEDSMTLATKAELYKLARAQVRSFRLPASNNFSSQFFAVQLDKLGVRAGHLPNSYPFNANITPASIPSSSADARGKPVKPANPISRRELYAALSDQATFDVLIQDTTLKAVKCLSTSGKGRSTLELSGSLALLDL
jgi:trafficking protein particle complex subunit 10